MKDITVIAAEARARAGKGTARAVRRMGNVPAVIYGGKESPALLAVEERLLIRELAKGSFFNRLFDIDLDGKKHRALARDIQFDPVTDRPVHVDFMRVNKDSRIRIFVPVIFTNHEQSPGLKRGGVLNVVRHEIEFYCQPEMIPDNIIINLAGREIGDSIHISAIALPEGVTPVIRDRDFTVATVAAPTTMAEPEAKAAVAAAAPADAKAAPAAAAAKPAAKK